MVGAKNRLAGELSGVTCPEKKKKKKHFNAFVTRQFKKKTKKKNNNDNSILPNFTQLKIGFDEDLYMKRKHLSFLLFAENCASHPQSFSTISSVT